ncbi:MAG: cobalt ECF transporter T component CbiQ [Terriglobia bacterium]
MKSNFVERTLVALVDGIRHALAAEEIAHANGLLQSLDPRVKVAGILIWIIAAATSRSLWVILALFIAALTLAILSRAAFGTLGKTVWIPVLIFTGAISLPALFLTPGQPLVAGWPVTAQGATAAAYLVGRAETAATLAVLLALSTPWNHILKSLRVFGLPAALVVILGMTYRQILLLLQIACDMFRSRQSRMVGRLDGQDRRRVAAASAGVLLSKSLQMGEDVYAAMQSRGFRGEVRTLDDFRLRWSDAFALAILLALALAAFWLGR